ncbi:MAG: hypothetical protein NT069_31360 [Planctomycetota bacterium]|nr:hypothetical protein [Planctomycetota bacterium]
MLARGMKLDFKNRKEDLLAWNAQTVEEVERRLKDLAEGRGEKGGLKPNSDSRQTAAIAATANPEAVRPPTPPASQSGAIAGQPGSRKPTPTAPTTSPIAAQAGSRVVALPTPGTSAMSQPATPPATPTTAPAATPPATDRKPVQKKIFQI